MRTPSIGIMNIFVTEKARMAPRGRFPHSSRERGSCTRATADPRHMRPSGTEAAPTKVALHHTILLSNLKTGVNECKTTHQSSINANGGCPSGAFGIGELLTGVKSALSGVTAVITMLAIIVTEHGKKKLRAALFAIVSMRRRMGERALASARPSAALGAFTSLLLLLSDGDGVLTAVGAESAAAVVASENGEGEGTRDGKGEGAAVGASGWNGFVLELEDIMAGRFSLSSVICASSTSFLDGI